MKFEEFFAQMFGERWPALRAALVGESKKIELESPFPETPQVYRLDAASLMPAAWLAPQAGEVIGDFCSAPGGKLLSMIYACQGRAEFHAYDLSKARASRLRSVLFDCLPEEIANAVSVRALDASRLGQRDPDSFDAVLVDAPCSGEAHLLESSEEDRWTSKASQRLAVRQHALLCSALDSTRPGGRVVYSTCSISPFENDGVIDKILKSRVGQVKVVTKEFDGSEATKHGRIVLPDRGVGGPIYAAFLQKVPMER
ncbi:MAG: RsmB/NOP family class I SAM-dependent RNA methyltransferase [Bdellovibrionales bacterium]